MKGKKNKLYIIVRTVLKFNKSKSYKESKSTLKFIIADFPGLVQALQ